MQKYIMHLSAAVKYILNVINLLNRGAHLMNLKEIITNIII